MSTHAEKLAAALRAMVDMEDWDDVEAGDGSTVGTAKAVLAQHDLRTFASDCHELADRAQVVVRCNPGLRPSERSALRAFALAGHCIGDDAQMAPDLYTEAESTKHATFRPSELPVWPCPHAHEKLAIALHAITVVDPSNYISDGAIRRCHEIAREALAGTHVPSLADECNALADRLGRISAVNDEPFHRSLSLRIMASNLRNFATTWGTR